MTRAYPPTLLLHGDADTDVPFSQSEQMTLEFERVLAFPKAHLR